MALRLDGCNPGEFRIMYAVAEQRDCQILPIHICELGKRLRDIVLYSTHIVQNRLVWFLLGAHQLFDIYSGLVWNFEDRNDLLAEFRVGIRFVELHFGAMSCIEVIDHGPRALPFRHPREGKIIFNLLYPNFNRNLTSTLEFGYTAGYG